MKNKIPGSVYILGFVSLFNDIASEMLYPIMPIFLTQILNAPIFIIGIIDGVAEGVSSFMKAYLGYLSDKMQKRKPFVFAGYGFSAISKVIIAFSSTWPFVFLGRILDRFGKGVRTGSRDALLLEAASKDNKGLVFGLHRSLDSLGAVIGPIIALVLLSITNNNIRLVLYIAALPSFVALLLLFFIKEAKKKLTTTYTLPSFSFALRTMSPELKTFLLSFAVFSLGNSSDSFLILQSKQLGMSVALVVLVYIVYNIVYTLLSTPAGILADKWGAKKVFIVGLVLYALVYFGFAINKTVPAVWLLFALYGGYIALTDGVSKALVGEYISKSESGTVYGILQTIASVGVLLASVIGGLLWSAIAPAATFYFGGVCAVVALVIFTIGSIQKVQTTSNRR
ncbi:MAG: MFS transporter [Patescibacteria group bacterium]|jgi:MFS family permease